MSKAHEIKQQPDGTFTAWLVDGPSIAGSGATEEEATTNLIVYLRDLVNARNTELNAIRDIINPRATVGSTVTYEEYMKTHANDFTVGDPVKS